MSSLNNKQLLDLNYAAFVHARLPFSMNDRTKPCLYAGPRGTGCAIGIGLPRKDALFLDEHSDLFHGSIQSLDEYVENEEDHELDDIRIRLQEIYSQLEDVDLSLMVALQYLHDTLSAFETHKEKGFAYSEMLSNDRDFPISLHVRSKTSTYRARYKSSGLRYSPIFSDDPYEIFEIFMSGLYREFGFVFPSVADSKALLSGDNNNPELLINTEEEVMA